MYKRNPNVQMDVGYQARILSPCRDLDAHLPKDPVFKRLKESFRIQTAASATS